VSLPTPAEPPARGARGAQGQPVAIKILYCMELTPSVVENFYNEAVTLSGLQHPR
jgi:hypothetical protein